MARLVIAEPSSAESLLLRLGSRNTGTALLFEIVVATGKRASWKVTEDPGTSDMYMNWRPGNMDDHKMGIPQLRCAPNAMLGSNDTCNLWRTVVIRMIQPDKVRLVIQTLI